MGNVVMAWISGITGLVILVLTYSVFMPFMSMLVNITTSLGAPSGVAFFLINTLRWGFIILGVVCIAYPFIYAYKTEYDQGQEGFR
jgi:hypothetical protein